MIKLGLIGEKLGHSKSPQIHSMVLGLLGVDADYSLIETPIEKLGEKFDELRRNNWTGINVTIPHKINIIKFLTEVSSEALGIGAVNTVSFTADGAKGYNTDYFGFQKLLCLSGIDPLGKKITILGTGGGARAVIHCFSDNNCAEITLVSRAPDKIPPDLKALPKTRTASYAELNKISGDIIVNCTPLGMFPDITSSPADRFVLGNFQCAVDIIYNPMQTTFLRYAEDCGLQTAGGMPMLVAQAVAADEIWLQRKIGDDILKTVIREMTK